MWQAQSVNDTILKKAKALHDKMLGKDNKVSCSNCTLPKIGGVTSSVACECECRRTVGSSHPVRKGNGTRAGSSQPTRSRIVMRGLEKRVRPVENNASSAGSLGTKRAIAPTSVRSGDGKVSVQVAVQIIFVYPRLAVACAR